MKSKTRRNTKLKNSRGISSKEYLLSNKTGYVQDRELKDYDYLDKLTPEELAWLAEFNANYVSGVTVDANVVGKETAEILNATQNKRDAYNRKNSRNRDVCNKHSRQSIDHDRSALIGKTEEVLINVDSYIKMNEDLSNNIDSHWYEKRHKCKK